MKSLRILFAILLCIPLFHSCTTDDILEKKTPLPLKQVTIFISKIETPLFLLTGDDENEPGDKDD